MILVSIIEDNHHTRAGWLSVLGRAEDVKVVGSFGTCEEAISSGGLAESDVVLMDIGLPGMSGIEGVRYVREHHPQIATVMCTVYEDDQKVFDALCEGAVGYLLKKISGDDLIKGIRDAASGGSPMTPSIARKVIATFHKPPVKPSSQGDALTDGELATLTRLAQGKSYAVIAQELYLSVDGIRNRIRRIYEKLQAHTRSEAVAKGFSRRLIDPTG